jgi:hypothetical protein
MELALDEVPGAVHVLGPDAATPLMWAARLGHVDVAG